MSGPLRATLLAGLAVLLASSSLRGVYDGLGWVPEVVGVVLAVSAAGLLARRLRVPALLQPAFGVVAGGAYVTLLYASDTLIFGLVPTRETAATLGTRIGEGLLDVEQLVPPVPTDPGLVLLAVLGVGAVAVLVDLVAVALHRPAAAGLLLLTLLVVPSGTLEGGVGVLPFVLGAAGWLALLLSDSSERVGRWGTALRPGAARRGIDENSLGRVGRRIGVAALGVAVVVPALLPGLDARLLDGGSGSGFGGSRTTTTYNPITELGGQLRLPEPRPLLDYATTDPQPDYLRLTTLDRFDDASGWSSSELSADVNEDAVADGIPMPIGVTSASVQPTTTDIRVIGLGGPWLPVSTTPLEVDIDERWLWDRRSSTVFSTRTDVREVDDAYRVTAERVLPDPAALRQGGPRPPEITELAEPPVVSPYVQQLTAEVVAGATTDYDRVVALQEFFLGGNGFEYSEDTSVPGTTTAPNALEQFLRDRRGFCEQYASAMAAMVRLQGIPARVAIGFTPGERRPDGTYRVTTSDAHAWPEVWFPGDGWVRFEPTPRSEQVTVPGYTSPTPETDDAGTPDPQTPADTATPPPLGEAPGTAADRERLLREDLAAPGGGGQDSGGLPGRVLLGIAAVLLVVLGWPAALAALRRRRRWTSPDPHSAWAQVVEDAVDVGHRWRPSDSPRAAAAHLLTQRELPAGAAIALGRVATAVERARYARPSTHGSTTGAEPDAGLRHDVATVRSALLSAAPARARWVARLAPPSTLRWAASTTGGAIADGLDRLDELTAAVGRRLRRSRRTRPA